MTRLRITLVGPFWPYRGGIAHFFESLQRSLSARGHVANALTFRRQYPELLFPGKTQYSEGAPPEEPAPRVLDTLNPRSWLHAATAIAESGSQVAILAYWMPFHAPALGVLARRLRTKGVRVLTLVHNAIPHERRPGDRFFGRFALRASDGLIVLSDEVGRDVRSIVPSTPVRQVAHPVYDLFGEALPRPDARNALGLDAGRPVLLFFGFIRPYKGLHVLLEAMPRILEAIPDALLLVAGEFYADEEALRRQAAPLGDAVRFDAAYIPDEQVGTYFCAADVVVQPYLSATQSGVAQIAFHFERPVVTTNVGGLAETVPHGVAGLVVPPGDADALAAAVIRFFEAGMDAKLRAGVRRVRTNYSWDRVCEVIEELASL